MKRISDLAPGDKVRLVDFGAADRHYRRRLLSLGLTCGTEFLIVRMAPLGCPMQIQVRGTSLILRKEEVAHLLLEYV